LSIQEVELDIPTARVFRPLLEPARYKAAYGGRGSGKSHFFAGLMVERAYAEPGLRCVCIREVQKDLSESAKRLLEDKIEAFGLGAHFDCQRAQIVTPGGGVIIFEGMQDHNSESIKSLEGFDVAWVEEAQTLSATSLGMLRPTIRKNGSELWFSWNPRREADAVDDFFRGPKATRRGVVVSANWKDNPWFPAELEEERLEDAELRAGAYPHVWDGDYQTVTEGAYYAEGLTKAKLDGRIGFVARDPNMAVRTFWDLGRRDFTSIWVAQFIGQKISVIDYIEGAGQPPAYYFDQLRERGYRGCMVYLPHDGSKVGPENASGRSYEDQARDAGFDVEVILNQGQGAAMLRIDAGRRLFPRIWFDETKTDAGRKALGAYHERKDEKRNTGLGPEHDWSSHGADAFGLMCVAYEEPRVKREAERPRRTHSTWMGGR
jgi:phage terminase large subunit